MHKTPEGLSNYMDRYNLKQYPSFALFPAFTAGIGDSINPCGLASALILIMYLSLVGYTQKRVFWLGLLFILFSGLTHFGLAAGFFDYIIATPGVMHTLRILYFLLAAVFLVLGFLNISDRWQYEKYFDTGRFKYKVPAFFETLSDEKPAGKVKKFFIFVRFILFAMGSGFIVTLCSSIYPQDEYIFIVHSYLMSGGNAKFVFLSFFYYSVTANLPLITAWIVILFLGRARKKMKMILYYKGISAALFLSVGIGLGYFLAR